MKQHPSLFILAAALVALGSARPVQADDYKSISIYSCMPANPAQAADLVFGMSGVRNDGAGARRVNCPLPRDQQTAIVADVTIVKPHFRTAGTPGSVSCTVQHGVYDAFWWETGSSGSRPAYSGFYLVLAAMESPELWAQAQMSLTCNLAPGLTMTHIEFVEGGATNG